MVQLEAEFEATPGEIESDVLRTLGEYAAEGLIQVCATHRIRALPAVASLLAQNSQIHKS